MTWWFDRKNSSFKYCTYLSTQAANMATNEIDVICGQLINAVRAMMDPMTPSQVRLNAFKHCEQFKEESPADLGIQCAITLSSSSGNLQHT